MAKIESLDVTVKYRVGLGGVTLPKKVLQQLEDAELNGHTLDLNSRDNEKYRDATEWLIDNIKERDCYEWQCEIDELTK